MNFSKFLNFIFTVLFFLILPNYIFSFSAFEVSVDVPQNYYNQLAQQLKEKENFLEKNLSELESFRKKLFLILFPSLTVLFLLTILHFWLDYKWKKQFSFYALHFTNKNPTKNSFKGYLFYNLRAPDLREFGEKIIKFSQKIPQENSFKLPKERLSKIGEIFKNSHWEEEIIFRKNLSDKINFYKKKNRNLRHILNEIQKRKNIDSSLKKEVKILWQQSHQISLFFAFFLKENK